MRAWVFATAVLVLGGAASPVHSAAQPCAFPVTLDGVERTLVFDAAGSESSVDEQVRLFAGGFDLSSLMGEGCRHDSDCALGVLQQAAHAVREDCRQSAPPPPPPNLSEDGESGSSSLTRGGDSGATTQEAVRALLAPFLDCPTPTSESCRTLTLTVYDENYADLAPKFYSQLAGLGMATSLVMVTMDPVAHAQGRRMGLPVLELYRLCGRQGWASSYTDTEALKRRMPDRVGANLTVFAAVDEELHFKVTPLRILLDAGFNVLLVEMDILVFRNLYLDAAVAAVFAAEPRDDGDLVEAGQRRRRPAQMVVSAHTHTPIINIGIVAVRAAQETVAFMRALEENINSFKRDPDVVAFDQVIWDAMLTRNFSFLEAPLSVLPGHVSWAKLDPCAYTEGCWHPLGLPPEACPNAQADQVVTWHVTGCTLAEKKAHMDAVWSGQLWNMRQGQVWDLGLFCATGDDHHHRRAPDKARAGPCAKHRRHMLLQDAPPPNEQRERRLRQQQQQQQQQQPEGGFFEPHLGQQHEALARHCTGAFVDACYNGLFEHRRLFEGMRFLGIRSGLFPLDAHAVQELFFEVKPALVLETGTDQGGSAAYYAMLLETMGLSSTRVLTCDVADNVAAALLPGGSLFETLGRRITFLRGSVGDAKVDVAVDAALAAAAADNEEHHHPEAGRPVFVTLDSDHAYAHVLAELRFFAARVPVGSFIFVQDTRLSYAWAASVSPGSTMRPDHAAYTAALDGNGPADAIDAFLRAPDPHTTFAVDGRFDKLLVSNSAGGLLRRVR